MIQTDYVCSSQFQFVANCTFCNSCILNTWMLPGIQCLGHIQEGFRHLWKFFFSFLLQEFTVDYAISQEYQVTLSVRRTEQSVPTGWTIVQRKYPIFQETLNCKSCMLSTSEIRNGTIGGNVMVLTQAKDIHFTTVIGITVRLLWPFGNMIHKDRKIFFLISIRRSQ